MTFLASLDRRSENVRILPIVITNWNAATLGNIKMPFVNEPEKHGRSEPATRSRSRRRVDRGEAATRRQGEAPRHREWCRGRSQRRPRRTDQRCFHNPNPASLGIGRQHRGDERTPWNEQVPANLPYSIVLSGT